MWDLHVTLETGFPRRHIEEQAAPCVAQVLNALLRPCRFHSIQLHRQVPDHWNATRSSVVDDAPPRLPCEPVVHFHVIDAGGG